MEVEWRTIIIKGVDTGFEISSEGIRKKTLKRKAHITKFRDRITLNSHKKIIINPYIIYDYLFADILQKPWIKINFDEISDEYMISSDDMRIINTDTLKEVHVDYTGKYRLNTIHGTQLSIPYNLMKWQLATKIPNDEYGKIISTLKKCVAKEIPYLKIECNTFKVLDRIFLKITSDRYNYPVSVLKESNGNKKVYCIRSGKHWYDSEYYGQTSYMETSENLLVKELINLFNRFNRNDSYIKNKSITNRTGKYNCPITEKECHTICQIFVDNDFCIAKTIKIANEMNISLSSYYMRRILNKTRFANISNQYFKINSNGFYSVKK